MSIISINEKKRDSFIVDGACRLGVLSDFQQGKLPMVVTNSIIPERVSFRPYGVPASVYSYDNFVYEADTLVEVYYDGLQADQQRAFLDAKVDVRKFFNLSLEDEKQVYWQSNYMCPSSPVYTSEYDEAEDYAKVASLLPEEARAKLPQIMNLIGGVHRNMACAELLMFLRKLLPPGSTEESAQDTEEHRGATCQRGEGARNPTPAWPSAA
jgi:hypothetical protein